MCIGDILRCGSVVMQVSQPRMPCFKQARRIDQPDFVKLILQTCRTGFLTRILEPGTMQVGDALELVERPLPDVPLVFVLQTFARRHPDDMATLAEQPLLANEWRERFVPTKEKPRTRNDDA
jgi:MOSC domain-containing protein YiiM